MTGFLLALFLYGLSKLRPGTPWTPPYEPVYKPKPKPTPKPAPGPTPAPKPVTAPVPWPAAVPKDLPVFPMGWEPDQPPPPAVQARAATLLKVLWARGAGARQTEKTGGRWITYQAQPMGTKKGVVAYRLTASAAPADAPTS